MFLSRQIFSEPRSSSRAVDTELLAKMGNFLGDPERSVGTNEVHGSDLHGMCAHKNEFKHILSGRDAPDADDRDFYGLADLPDAAQRPRA